MAEAEFPNNKFAAQAVFSYIRAIGLLSPDHTLRPFNRFDEDFTDWWIIPSRAASPAFRHGKLFFSTVEERPDPPKRMYCGYYVEKGLGPSLSTTAGVGHQYIMQPDWYWHEFMRLASLGAVDCNLRQVLAMSKIDLHLGLDAYEFNHVVGPDEVRRPPHDRLLFTLSSPYLTFHLDQPAHTILAPLNSCKNLRELAVQLAGVPGVDFFWVNLLIGVYLDYGGTPPTAWGAEELWCRALDPWWRWVR